MAHRIGIEKALLQMTIEELLPYIALSPNTEVLEQLLEDETLYQKPTDAILDTVHDYIYERRLYDLFL